MPSQDQPRRLQILIQLVSLSLMLALLAGCTFSGRVTVPTAPPPRLLDPTVATTPVTTPLPNQTAAAQPTAVPGERTLVIIGLVELIVGEIWTIDGTLVRVPAAIQVAQGIGVGTPVRVVVRLGGDDDDDDREYVAISVEALTEVTLVGQITLIDAASIIVDGRTLVLRSGFVLPQGLILGVIVRVVAGIEGSVLVVRSITILPEAQVVGGAIELISGNIIVIGGQRYVLAPDTLIWRVRLIVGQPVRIIVIVREGVLTIVTITIVTIIVPPPVVVVPPPVVVEPPPAPRPPAPRPPGNSGGGDDDDDDDDD